MWGTSIGVPEQWSHVDHQQPSDGTAWLHWVLWRAIQAPQKSQKVPNPMGQQPQKSQKESVVNILWSQTSSSRWTLGPRTPASREGKIIGALCCVQIAHPRIASIFLPGRSSGSSPSSDKCVSKWRQPQDFSFSCSACTSTGKTKRRSSTSISTAAAPAKPRSTASTGASTRQQHLQSQNADPKPHHWEVQTPNSLVHTWGIETSHKTLRITRVGPPATELDFLRRLWPPMGRHHMPYIDCLGNTVHKVCIHM